MRRPRWRLRTRMVVVAIVGLVCAVVATRQRWANFRRMASEMGVKAEQCRFMADVMRLASAKTPTHAAEIDNATNAAEYDRLARECERAKVELERRSYAGRPSRIQTSE